MVCVALSSVTDLTTPTILERNNNDNNNNNNNKGSVGMGEVVPL